MHLTIRDLTRLFNTTESTVTRWIKQGRLPNQHVSGQYRFHRADVLEWATANRIQVSPELFEDQESAEEPVPSLAEALEAGGIFYKLQDTTKEKALRALVDVLPLPEGLDRERLLSLFLAREYLVSTAIGGGIALPHVRNPIVLNVDHPMVTLAYLEKPVDFGAPDGKPVHVLFSLICPTMRGHLQMLARLSYVLHDTRFREVVLRMGSRDEIMAEARQVEAALAEAGANSRKAAP